MNVKGKVVGLFQSGYAETASQAPAALKITRFADV